MGRDGDGLRKHGPASGLRGHPGKRKGQRGTLDKVFASLIFAVAASMLYRTGRAWT